MMERDEVPTSTVALVWVVGVLALLAILLGLDVVYRQVATWQEAVKNTVEPWPAVAAALAEEEALLHEYRLVDAKNGVVRIPIERAMELVVAEMSGGARQAAGPPAHEVSHGTW